MGTLCRLLMRPSTPLLLLCRQATLLVSRVVTFPFVVVSQNNTLRLALILKPNSSGQVDFFFMVHVSKTLLMGVDDSILAASIPLHQRGCDRAHICFVPSILRTLLTLAIAPGDFAVILTKVASFSL